MAPLSAVALSFWLALLGLNWITWITVSPKVLGIFAIVALVVILLDTFWFRTSDRWAARRAA